MPAVVHKVILVTGLTLSSASLMKTAFCGPQFSRCARFENDTATGRVAFDYLPPAATEFRVRKTTSPCDESTYNGPNATAAVLACCQSLQITCTNVELTANYSGTPEFPVVGFSNFVACDETAHCPEGTTCVDNTCAAAVAEAPSTTPTTTATTGATTSTTTAPESPEETFPGALPTAITLVAVIQAAAILVEILAPVVVENGSRTVISGGLLTESFL